MAVTVGSVSVNVVPDGTGFARELKRIVDDASKSAIATITIDIDTATAKAQFERLLKSLRGRRAVKIDVEIDNDIIGTAVAGLTTFTTASSAAAKGADALAEGGQAAASGFKALMNTIEAGSEAFKGTAKVASKLGSDILTTASGAAAATAALVEETVATSGLNLVLLALAVAATAAGGALTLLAGAILGAALAAAAFTAAAVIAGAVMTALAAAAVAAGGALAAMPGILGAAAGAFAVLAIAIMPVVEAFQAWNSLEKSSAGDAQKAAKARQQSARAIRSAGEAVVKANKQVAQAETAVTKARQQAIKDLEGLKKAAEDAARAQASASRNVQEAALAVANLDPTASIEDRIAAENNLANAQDSSVQAANNTAEAQAEYNEAQRLGVEGSERVQQALAGLVSAQEAAAEAQRSYVETQQDQAAALAESSSQADTYNQALAALSTQGLALLEVLKEFKKILDPVSKALQDATFPGFISFLRSASSLLGTINEKTGQFQPGPLLEPLKQIGSAISGVAAQFGELFKDPQVVANLKTLLQIGAQAISALGGPTAAVFKDLLSSFAALGKAAQPFFGALGEGFRELGGAVSSIFKVLANPQVMGPLIIGFTALVGIISDLLTMFGPFIADLIKIGGPIIAQLRGPLVTIFQAILDIFSQMASGGLLSGFVVLMQSLATIFMDLVDSGVITQLSEAFGIVLSQLGGALIEAVKTLIPALPSLIDSFLLLTLVFIDLLPVLLPIITEIIKNLVPVLPTLIGAIITVARVFEIWLTMLNGGLKILGWVTEGIKGIITWFTDLYTTVDKYADGMWDTMAEGFKEAINTIIRAWNGLDLSINFKIPDWVPVIGGDRFKVDDIFPDIPLLASGGIVNKPTLAVVGEAGPEAIIPLTRQNALASSLGNLSALLGSDLPIGGRTFNFNQYGAINENVDADLVLQKFRMMSLGM